MMSIIHDHDYGVAHTINTTDNNIDETMLSIAHDHDYSVLHLNDHDYDTSELNNGIANNIETIDDNIEALLSSDQNFGIMHYESDDEVIFKNGFL